MNPIEKTVVVVPINEEIGEPNAYVERQICDWRTYKYEENGEMSLLRFNFAQLPDPRGVSKTQSIRPLQIYHGGTGKHSEVVIAVISGIRRGLWARSRCVPPEMVLKRCKHFQAPIHDAAKELICNKNEIVEVTVGKGARTNRNIDGVFLFSVPPPELPPNMSEQDRLNFMADWVCDFVDREGKEQLQKLNSEAKVRDEKALSDSPAQFPHEDPEIDHYKNRAEVIWTLLRRQWPLLFRANDNLSKAKSEAERNHWQKQVWLGYIIDHQSVFGHSPEIRQEEAIGLWCDEEYLALIRESPELRDENPEKRSWELVNGWICKGYYRMSEIELEAAFNRDWNHKPGLHKGNTLAKHARQLGLRFAVPRGRKEIRKFDDSAL